MKRFSGITISIILLTSYCVKAERPAYSINSAPGILASVVMSFIGTGTTYTIGGTISGLTGSGLVLTNNNGDNLTVASGATSFVFPTAIADGSVYNVQVLTYPTGPVEVCAASNNANTVSGGNVSNVSITCVPGFNIGGTLSGLLSATNIVLQNNAGDDITVSANGSFTFPTPLPNSAAYNVTVLTQPSNTRCFVSAGSGTVAADVTTIVITCPVAVKNSLNWMRCSHGQIWNATAGDCTGTGSSTSYFGAQIFKYCSLQDNSCNDANPLGEDSTVLGHLDGGGTSEAWNACQSLNAGSGTYGITTWRVPRKSELTGILYCSNGSTIPPNCNSGSSSPTIDTVMFPNTVVGTGVLGKYWTSSADFTQDPFFAWYVDFNTGILNAWGKNNSLNVRCVSTTGP